MHPLSQRRPLQSTEFACDCGASNGQPFSVCFSRSIQALVCMVNAPVQFCSPPLFSHTQPFGCLSHVLLHKTHGRWCTVRDMMREVRAGALDHRTGSAGLGAREACQRTSHSPQRPDPRGGGGGGCMALANPIRPPPPSPHISNSFRQERTNATYRGGSELVGRGTPPPPCASTAAVPKNQAKQRFNAHPVLRQACACVWHT